MILICLEIKRIINFIFSLTALKQEGYLNPLMCHFLPIKREFEMTKKTENKPGALTKRALIDHVASTLETNNVSLSKTQIKEIITHIFAAIKSEVVSEGKYTQPRFGTFEIRDRKARTGRSPLDGTPIDIPASRIVGLKVSKFLKESIN